MKLYMCPAGFNNLFPFLKIDIPSCIDFNQVRCPDWQENIYYRIDEDSRIKKD